MATIKNPTRWNLWCHPLRRELRPGEVVEGLTDEVAERITRTGVFESLTPRRRPAKRGAQVAEVTAPPKVERR